LKILLYKPGAATAFRMYNSCHEVIIPKDGQTVNIMQVTASASVLVETFALVIRGEPMWTDDTKENTEIMVKLTVEELT
jgi:hypothetical protein